MASRSRRVAAVACALILGVLGGATPVSADGSNPCLTNNGYYRVAGGFPINSDIVADNLSASIEVQTLNRCNGTDPDGKNGAFVYIEIMERGKYDRYFAYDQGQDSGYGNYLRMGYYLCSWSGDSACNLGHGYFVSWSRQKDAIGCASSSAIGIHRLGPTSSGFHTFKIDIQSDKSVRFLLDGAVVYTIGASVTGCWNRRGHIDAAAWGSSWDQGDQIGGSAANHVQINNILTNGAASETFCSEHFVEAYYRSYRCAETGLRSFDIWTSD